jgi:hypothetical protein
MIFVGPSLHVVTTVGKPLALPRGLTNKLTFGISYLIQIVVVVLGDKLIELVE